MYTEKEVFLEINKFLKNDMKDIEKAYNIHRKLVSLIPEEIQDICYFRYLEKGGTIGLNINNYKIYEYHHKNKEAFRLIYPKDKVEELKNINIEPKVDFEFISIPAVLLEIELSEFDKFSDTEWENFKKALKIAGEGKENEKNIRNIDVVF